MYMLACRALRLIAACYALHLHPTSAFKHVPVGPALLAVRQWVSCGPAVPVPPPELNPPKPALGVWGLTRFTPLMWSYGI